MKNQPHENRLEVIEAECAELRRQILKLEFESKKDAVEARRAHEKFVRESEIRWQRYTELREQTRLHLNHLSNLTGLAFDDIFEIDARLDAASKHLARKRQRSE